MMYSTLVYRTGLKEPHSNGSRSENSPVHSAPSITLQARDDAQNYPRQRQKQISNIERGVARASRPRNANVWLRTRKTLSYIKIQTQRGAFDDLSVKKHQVQYPLLYWRTMPYKKRVSRRGTGGAG